ncbi:mucosal pentraxin-like [Nelusetta ayraudi]|uniref:mucosal pentraxin-like n=1 Tax=Nelusetta ayraudi TaxID=303726 RepID=UPI003F6F931E
MELLFLFLTLLSVCAASPQDLRHKMFTFPQETNTDRVTLTTEKQDFGAVTVCLRSFTDLTREYSLFSLATPSHDNGLTLFRTANGFNIYVRNSVITFAGLDLNVNTWHSICFTWDAVSGVGQLWLNGKHSVRKYISSGHITGTIIIILGQEQDSYGGTFDAKQSFVGMLSDVHMWNETIPRQEIMNYMENKYFSSGNVLNWRDLEFRVTGRALVEESQCPL